MVRLETEFNPLNVYERIEKYLRENAEIDPTKNHITLDLKRIVNKMIYYEEHRDSKGDIKWIDIVLENGIRIKIRGTVIDFDHVSGCYCG